ncbi:MAG: isoprenylcysteine carboxylmethyltransferase family protein [Proteobacteria bacterium]|nr:isoprenylcysteine carboxylmethyltransferase family protein [Pseudomonadota bacterium]
MKVLPPPIWAILALIATYFASALSPFDTWPSWQSQPLGALVFVIGMIGPAIAITQFRRAGTEVSPTSKTHAKLVVSGIYRFTRNPMYLGVTIASLGVAIFFGRPLMFIVPVFVFVITNWIFIPFEEAKMRRQFGAEFDAYTQRVRRWL